MKKIYPDIAQNKAALPSVQDKPITQQQYDDLVERTNTAEAKADSAKNALCDYKREMQRSVGTQTINADTGNISEIHTDNLDARNTTSNTIVTNNLIVQDTADINGVTFDSDAVNVHGRFVIMDVLDSGSINARDSITATNTFSQNACFNCACICNMELGNTTLVQANIGNLSADTTVTNTLYATCAKPENLHVTEDADIEGALNVGDVAKFGGDLNAARGVTTNYIDHSGIFDQYLRPSGDDYYIELPIFSDGEFLLNFNDVSGRRVAAVEIFNSKRNLMFRWSQDTLGQILAVADGSYDDGTLKAVIVVNNHSNGWVLKYFSNSVENREPPTIYTTYAIPTEGWRYHDITDRNGTYMDNLVVTDTLRVENLEMDQLSMDRINIYKDLGLTCAIDEFGKPVLSTGEDQQYAAVTTNADGITERISWNTPSDTISCEDTCLTPSNVIACYTGKTKEEEYPIKHLNCNTCVHGKITTCCACVEEWISTPHFCDFVEYGETSNISTGLQFNQDEDSNITLNKVTTVDGDQRLEEILAINCECTFEDKDIILYDADNHNFIPSKDIDLDSLNVDGDVHVGGDLYVEGKTITTEEETISTASDTIVLRQNNPSGLANDQISGVVVHNYDGHDNNAIVGVDKEGIVRIGDATGTDTIYPQIKLDRDGKWFVGDTEVVPVGELTKYDSKVVDGDFTVYTNATFTSFDLTDLEPVATRDETMTDSALTCWNAADSQLKTINAPAKDNVALIAHKDSVTNAISYAWEENGNTRVFRFAEMCDYENYTGDIPVGSIVYIDACENYVKGVNG